MCDLCVARSARNVRPCLPCVCLCFTCYLCCGLSASQFFPSSSCCDVLHVCGAQWVRCACGACAFCVRVCESRMHVQCFRSRGRVPVLLLCCDVSIVRYSFLLDSEKLICLSHVLRLWQSEQFVFQ